MDVRKWWKSLSQEVKNTFMLVNDGGAAPVRWNVQAILTCVFRIALYLVGTDLAYFSLISALSSWDLAPFLVNIAGGAVLILALVGLFFFFQSGLYQRGLKWTKYLWWILEGAFFLFVFFAVIDYIVASNNLRLQDLLGDAFVGILGIILMVIVYIPGKAPVPIKVSRNEKGAQSSQASQSEEDARTSQVIPPQHRFSELFLSPDLLAELRQAVDVLRTPAGSFENWGLPAEARISYVALHLYGRPGTGKTLAAHALADYLKKNILAILYADFQADTYAEINKNIRTAFDTAAKNNALLLIDEADTLLSHGVSQIISSQVRASLEQFHGVVIFATNAIETYNKAFETRVRHIHIPLPDEERRQQLWEANLPARLPRAEDVEPAILARQFSDLSGREIKRIIAEAAQKALAQQRQVQLSDLDEVTTRLKKERLHEDSDVTIDSLAKKQYEASRPKYTFEQLAVSESVKDELDQALAIVQNEAKIFDEWGLRSIEPFPCTALNFYGPSGTGKTLAAHALAAKLNKNILVANYGEIEGQLVGDGARNTTLIFRAATRENAVLFIDEADALLAQRLSNVSHSADMALNSLSNQMLIALENFHGVVIFATNMIQSYDKAFETRVRHIHFPLPDEACRRKIWKIHLPEKLPGVKDIDVVTLAAQSAEMCGRDIKNAVIAAVTKVQTEGRTRLELNDLLLSIKQINRKRLSADSNALREATRDYTARLPLYHYEQLILSKSVEDELHLALDMIRDEARIFDEWGLRSIEPFPCTALNFYGPPGTGKTLAAHALADYLGQSIMAVSYGEIVGRFVGDGPRNTEALFRTAARENAVLFIDEADALLAKRLNAVSSSADMELNAITNQMLVCLENFRGVVIFATNMIQSYDKAFETRVRHIHFPLPDEECRQRLWDIHLPKHHRRAADVDPAVLAAQSAELCGRDIKNAVVDAVTRVGKEGRSRLELSDLVAAIKRVKNARVSQQGEREEKYKRVVEHLQRHLHLEKSPQTPSARQSTRPLGDLLEQPAQVILVRTDAPLEHNGSAQQTTVPETPLSASVQPAQDDASEEDERTAPTQPLVRLQRHPSGQLEGIRD